MIRRLCKRVAIVCLLIVYGAACLTAGYLLAEWVRGLL